MNISRWEIFLRDVTNVCRFGPTAPRFAERINIDPRCCKTAVAVRRVDSAIVGDWRKLARFGPLPATEWPKVKYSLDHWLGGVPWSRTGVYELMQALLTERGSVDGCSTMDDVERRYRRLDEIFEAVRTDGRLRSVSEVQPSAFREYGGVSVHLDEHSEPVFGLSGCHRFAISLALGLKIIPAQLGCVHPTALTALPRLRQA